MGQTSVFGDVLSTAEVYPWLIDIDVFMTAVSHVNWDTIQMDTTNNIYGAQKNSGGFQNDEINFDVVLGIGTWTFELLYSKDSNRGIYTVSLDVTGTLGTIDAYAAAGSFNNRSSITGVSVASNGKQRLKLKMATKNASSSAYYGSIQHIQLRRTA